MTVLKWLMICCGTLLALGAVFALNEYTKRRFEYVVIGAPQFLAVTAVLALALTSYYFVPTGKPVPAIIDEARAGNLDVIVILGIAAALLIALFIRIAFRSSVIVALVAFPINLLIGGVLLPLIVIVLVLALVGKLLGGPSRVRDRRFKTGWREL